MRKYTAFTFDQIIIITQELFRITKAGGVVVWIVGDAVRNGSETGTSFRHALSFIQAGFLLHDTMIFQKNTTSFAARLKGTRYSQIFEYMFVFSKGRPARTRLLCDKPNKWRGYTNWGRRSIRTGPNDELVQKQNIKPVPEFSPRNNIWHYSVGAGFNTTDNSAYTHPAIFPEKLVEDHIFSWSRIGDTILDPFMGSGTTGKVALQMQRKFIGIEINKTFFHLAKTRLTQSKPNLTFSDDLFELGRQQAAQGKALREIVKAAGVTTIYRDKIAPLLQRDILYKNAARVLQTIEQLIQDKTINPVSRNL